MDIKVVLVVFVAIILSVQGAEIDQKRRPGGPGQSGEQGGQQQSSEENEVTEGNETSDDETSQPEEHNDMQRKFEEAIFFLKGLNRILDELQGFKDRIEAIGEKEGVREVAQHMKDLFIVFAEAEADMAQMENMEGTTEGTTEAPATVPSKRALKLKDLMTLMKKMTNP